MIGLDTNVLVRYLTQDDPDQAPRATALMESLTAAEPGFIGTVVLVEAYWVLTRSRYQVPPLAAAEALGRLVASDEIIAEDPAGVAGAVAAVRAGADFADALVDRAARRGGATVVKTFDRKASTTLGFELL